MKKLALAGALALVSSLALAQDMAPNGGMPPEEYRGEALAVVAFTDRIPDYCGKSDDPNYTIVACTYRDKRVIFMPNPCNLGDREIYARIMCHEKGHILGWRH